MNSGDSKALIFSIESVLCFLAYSFAALYVLINLRFRLDRSSILTILAFSISFLLRIMLWVSEFKIKNETLIHTLTIIDIFGSFFVKINLVFYTYEMLFVK